MRRYYLKRTSALVILVILALSVSVPAATRIKDIATLNNWHSTHLFGYGLVVGLEGTGDGKGTQFTIQSLVNMLQRMGVAVPLEKVKVKNVAAVMVTADLPPSAKVGATLDVTVSSIGDASSLQGGTLLLTPLGDLNGNLYATAQGPVSIGGFNVQVDENNKIVNNYTLVGRVPNGATIEREPDRQYFDLKTLQVTLLYPDYTTANRVRESVNAVYPQCASPLDNSTIELTIPDSLQTRAGWVQFISQIENLHVDPDAAARVVINEKTGTIVAGAEVSIAPVALAHGNITITVSALPVISQPEPLSQGKTVVEQQAKLEVSEEQARVVSFKEQTNIAEVAQALNAIGATPRDIIAIFEALKQTGALRAELIVL